MPIFKQFTLISDDIYRRLQRNEKRDYETANKQQITDIRDYLELLDEEDKNNLLSNLSEIRIAHKNDYYDTNLGLSAIFCYFLENNYKNFITIFTHNLITENSLYLDPRMILEEIFKHTFDEIKSFYKLISKNEYNLKQEWIISFFTSIPFNQIDQFYYDELNLFIKNGFNALTYYFHFDPLLKYEKFKAGSFVEICRDLFENRLNNKCRFFSLFNQFSDASNEIPNLFQNHISLLKEIWIYALLEDSNIDHKSTVLSWIINNDQSFFIEIMEARFKKDTFFYMHNDNRNYSFIWTLKNCFQIVDQLIIFFIQKSNIPWDMHVINSFFVLQNEGLDLRNIQIEYLESRIKDHCQDINFVNLLLIVIKSYFFDDYSRFLKAFLNCNKKFSDFENLNIEFHSFSGNGTFIKSYTKLLRLWEKILSLLDETNFLKHRLYVNKKIEIWSKLVSEEKKKGFHFDHRF